MLKSLSQAASELSENTRKAISVRNSGAQTQSSVQQRRAGAVALACSVPTAGDALLTRPELGLEICCVSTMFCVQCLR